MVLRLAVLLHRNRSQVDLPPITLTVNKRTMRLKFDADWLAANPLTVADLEREIGYLDKVQYRLSFS